MPRKNSWRYGSVWKRVKAKIRKKCNNRCYLCGVHGVDIHHIQDASTHPKLRYRHYNLKCLCKECHRVYFHIYFMDGSDKKCDVDDWLRFTLLVKHYISISKKK